MMKNFFNIILLIITVFCICIIAYVRLGIGFPKWHTDNDQNYNLVIENLSYSYIAGVFVYILTVVLPDWWESRRLRPLVDKKIAYIAVLFNKQLLGFGTPKSENHNDDFYQVDCTKIEEGLDVMDKADWNSANPVVNNILNNKLYQTYKHDLDAIILAITDLLQTYKSQLSQDDIMHLENMRQTDIVTYINVLYSANVFFPPDGHKFIVEKHKKLLEEYLSILKERNITLN